MMSTIRVFRGGAIACVLILLVASTASAQNKGKGNKGKKGDKGNKDGALDVVGTIWHYKLTKDAQTVNGNFRVFQQEIFRGAKKIGAIKDKGEEATFTVSGDPELNGQATYRMVQVKPRLYKGTLVRPDGEKWHLEMEPKDR